jgi:translation initiation factor 1
MCAPVGDKAKQSGHPFAALKELRDRVAKETPPTANVPIQPEGNSSPPTIARGPARAVVRLERKHRGGKEVTVIEKLALPAKELERWCRELKQALGCGGSVDGPSIVLQGDLRQRLPDVLTARGVGRVTVG